jgi:Helix-turn-helix domain
MGDACKSTPPDLQASPIWRYPPRGPVGAGGDAMAFEIQVRFLKVSEAARVYGVCPESLRKLVRDDHLTGYRPGKGRCIMLDVRELEAHFAASASR